MEKFLKLSVGKSVGTMTVRTPVVVSIDQIASFQPTHDRTGERHGTDISLVSGEKLSVNEQFDDIVEQLNVMGNRIGKVYSTARVENLGLNNEELPDIEPEMDL